MVQLTSKGALLAKFGGVPTPAEVVTLSENASIKVSVKTGSFKDVGNGSLGNEKSYSVPDMTTADITASASLAPTADATTPPALSEMLRACGLVETIGIDNVAYAPFVGMVNTATLVNYMDGEKRTVTGVSLSMAINFTVGELAKVSFSGNGFTAPEPTVEANPAVTLDGNGKFIVDSVQAVTLGGSVINLESADFDLGNNIQQLYAVGKKEYYIADFAPTIKVKDIKQKDVTTHWTDIKNGAINAFIIVLTNGARTFTLTAPNCSYSALDESDNNGAVSIDRTFRCEESAGSDNFEIKYT